MFSSFTSFLPSALLLNGSSHDNHTSTPPPKPAANQDTVQEHTQPVEDDIGAKKKIKNVNETFIVVRPPPAKSNHPLNLQVQLVPPAVRTTRQSLDDNDAASTATSLTRTASNRSDSSGYGSTASFSSTASTTSGRRMIIPLYNLQAHNVMTNTIVDAGTDAKIARFQKRGIELIDVATLEPVEVWGESGRGRTSRAATPDFTSEAYSSAVSLPYLLPSQSPSAQPAAIAPKRNPIFGKFFKKSDKDSTPPASPLASSFSTTRRQSTLDSSSATPTSVRRSTRGHTRNLSSSLSPSAIADKIRNRSSSPIPPMNLNVPEDNASIHSSNAEQTNPGPSSDEKALRPPVLGIQPALSYAHTPSHPTSPGPVSLSKNARALMYVWFVRKWLKRKDRGSFIGNMIDEEGTGLLGKIRGSPKTQGSPLVSTVVSEDVEVRFEWRRHGGKARARRGRLDARRYRASLVPGVDVEREESTERERTRERDVEHNQSNRVSVISHHSMSTNKSASEEGSPRRERPGTSRAQGRSKTREGGRRASRDGRDRERDADGEDPGEDSEPEDSETPWVCTLKIRKAGTGSTSAAAASLRTRTQQGEELLPADNGSPVTSQTIEGQEELGELPPPSQPTVLRVKVGTLSPTPHHPKVVAMLKVPFPLPDVEVERMGVRKRSMGQRSHSSQWSGTTLTAEEIKDVVCSTAMWLVVRESFGGIGKVTRRGDGWRIRA